VSHPAPIASPLGGAPRVAIPTHDVFHPILQLQLALLDRDFLELFRIRKEMLRFQFVQAVVELAMNGGEVAEFRIGLQKVFLQLLRICWHALPPE
jgi:hypothetical protein